MTALNLKINTGGFEDAAILNRSATVKNTMGRINQIMSLEPYLDMPDKYPGLASGSFRRDKLEREPVMDRIGVSVAGQITHLRLLRDKGDSSKVVIKNSG